MRLGITLEDERGMESNVSQHFGQCRYFLIVDIEGDQITGSKVVRNNAEHGGGGCLAVNEIMNHNVTHVISGGMGGGAQQKFAAAGVEVFGFSGTVKDAVSAFTKKVLGGLDACGGGHGHSCH